MSAVRPGVYIHIPFCRRKCLYCDFPSQAGDEALYERYTAALCREIAGRGGLLSDRVVDTVYIGGGTPTVLPERCLARLGRALRESFKLDPGLEFTVEANPGTVDGDKLAALLAMGVNRLSFGVQAFDDAVLAAAGRLHTAREAVAAVEAARRAGFANISIDLMYGLPGQSPESFRAGLEQAVRLPLRHISVYGLKVEEGTPFAAMAAAGTLALPDEDDEAAMYELAAAFLPRRGWGRYEISNYAAAGYECRHNLKYWRYQPYLGLGAAAHSFWDGERLANLVGAGEYIARMEAGACPVAERERAGRETAMAEFAFLALRTAAGLDFASFRQQFGVDFLQQYSSIIGNLAARGLIERGAAGIRPTPAGMRYGNIVFGAFLPDIC